MTSEAQAIKDRLDTESKHFVDLSHDHQEALLDGMNEQERNAFFQTLSERDREVFWMVAARLDAKKGNRPFVKPIAPPKTPRQEGGKTIQPKAEGKITFKKDKAYDFTNTKKHVGMATLIIFALDGGWYALARTWPGDVAKVADKGHWLDWGSWNGGERQQWTFSGTQDVYIELRSSGEVITVEGLTNTVLRPKEDLDTQKWNWGESRSIPFPTLPSPTSLGDIPRFSKPRENLPDRTDPVVTAYTLVPCIVVQESWGAEQQIKESPYYLMLKKEYWRKEFQFDLPKGNSIKAEKKWGMIVREREEIEQRLGIEVKADIGFSYKAISASLSGAISYELKVSKSTETELIKEYTEWNEYGPAKQNTSYALYSRVCEFSLYRTAGQRIGGPWAVVKHNDTRMTTWPAKASMKILPAESPITP